MTQPTPAPNTKQPANPPPQDTVLEYAWTLYETYSEGSQTQKRANSNVRQRIIWLIFYTSVLAVLGTLPGVQQLFALFGEFVSARGGAVGTWVVNNIGANFIRIILVILSAATTAFLSYAIQFTPLRAWIMYRVGADRIRSEIYMYRLRAGNLYEQEEDATNRRNAFLDRIEGINRQIYELETAPPHLQLLEEKNNKFELSKPRIWFRRMTTPLRLGIKRAAEGQPTKRLQGTVPARTATNKRLSGRYNPERDDGFNSITVDDYIEYRVKNQRDWYVKKVYEDYERTKDWRRVILVISGATVVLAAAGLEPYIVITTAALVAVNTHTQLNLIGGTYGNYHVTASRIDAELVRWYNLPIERQQDPIEISRFVTAIETIFEEERTVWMQQASQAQQESEQSLIKGSGRRDGVPSLLENNNIQPPTKTNVESAPQNSAPAPNKP